MVKPTVVRKASDRLLDLIGGIAQSRGALEHQRRRSERVWALLEVRAAAPPSVHGRIPGFFGAEEAAERLAILPIWQAARTIKANPDKAQLPVRARAFTEGKVDLS